MVDIETIVGIGITACIAVIIIAFKYILLTSSKEDEILSNLKDVSSSLKNLSSIDNRLDKLSSIDNRLESLEGNLKNINEQIKESKDTEKKNYKRIYVPDTNFRSFLEDSGVGKIHGDYVVSSNLDKFKKFNLRKLFIGSLEGIEEFKNLIELDCSDNQLISLDVSKNTNLTVLNCNKNQLTTIDVFNNTDLKTLHCNSNQLTSLDMSNNSELILLKCGLNQLTTLDVSNTNIKTLHCNSNQLTSLDLSFFYKDKIEYLVDPDVKIKI